MIRPVEEDIGREVAYKRRCRCAARACRCPMEIGKITSYTLAFVFVRYTYRIDFDGTHRDLGQCASQATKREDLEWWAGEVFSGYVEVEK